MKYNWQQNGWPHFEYNEEKFTESDLLLMQLAGVSRGTLLSNTVEENQEIVLDLLITEALKNAAIEEEYLNRNDLYSSIKHNLGWATKSHQIKDKRAEGMAELLVLMRNNYNVKISELQLFQWHSMIMRGSYGLNVGVWRTHPTPMQVISGSFGKEIIHYEAPPSTNVPRLMSEFILWYNDSANKIKSPIIRSALAHLYFESIHPFEDGNGRIGRIIAEKALSQSVGQPVLLSISKAIDKNRQTYYDELKKAQRTLIVNDWIQYFGEVLISAQKDFISKVKHTINKTAFFDFYKNTLNARQVKALHKMYDSDGDFEGGMNARKYASINHTSKATATRDLQELYSLGILKRAGGGRSTSYELISFEQNNNLYNND